MKLVSVIARNLLGLLFFVFGLNGFLHFLPMGPMPAGFAGQFVGALVGSHYMTVVFLAELIPAVLLLANRYVPLALAVLAAVIVNILLFHIFMAPAGLPLAVVAAVLWILSVYRVRRLVAVLFEQHYAA